MARKPKNGKRPSKEEIKAKAERAEARSKGEEPEIEDAPSPLDPPEVRRAGRATKYTPEIGKRICMLLKEGRTLTSICRDNPDLPTDQTVRNWAMDPEHEFSSHYALAREVGYHAMADGVLDVADESVEDATQAARNRLRVDTRKWLLSKALPKIYGDKIEQTIKADEAFAGLWQAMTPAKSKK